MPSQVTAIVPAAGLGVRMGKTQPRKQYMELAGRPLLEWTLNALSSHKSVGRIILVVPPDDLANVRTAYMDAPKHPKLDAVIEGGAKRADSVRQGLMEASSEWVLIHDGVRPFVSADLIQKTIDSAMKHGAAAAAIPIRDTVKRKNADYLAESVDRNSLMLVQTPQVFRRDDILNAFEKMKNEKMDWTDETSIMEKAGMRVAWVMGEPENIKVTTSEDFRLAERIMGKSP